MTRWTVVFALLCAGFACSSTERALRNVGCDEAAAPLVTDFLMNKWGLGSFACLRAQTGDAAQREQLERACTLARAPRAEAAFSALDLPVSKPAFWDLREGETVERALLHGTGEHWRGVLFRKVAAGAEVWLMCAGGL